MEVSKKESSETIDLKPSKTLYVSNLNEKVKRPLLKSHLYTLFSPYGQVLQVNAKGGSNLKGQAWVIFNDATASSAALKALQNFTFYNRPLRIQYAKETSKIIAKQEGTYNPAAKRVREETVKESKPQKPAKSSRPANAVTVSTAAPNKTLIVQGLGTSLDANQQTDLLHEIFSKFNGFVSLRVVPERGLAFVEYDNDSNSTPALQNTHNLKLSEDQTLTVTYAK